MKTALIVLGALLIVGSTTETATALEHYRHNAYRASMAQGEQFLNASNSLAAPGRGFCSQEAGNPYNEQTDYLAWSSFRAHGSWDSRNDCP